MTEKEKMLAGEPYDPSDPELAAGRKAAREITGDYNRTAAGDVKKRMSLLNKLLGGMVYDVFIEPPFYCDYGSNIYIANNVYINLGCVFLDCAAITIGADVKFGPNVQLYTPSHPLDPATRKAAKELAKPIRIGNNCWIGGNVTVCPGVSIGENAVIGAGSVVVKDIPGNVVAVGNPCRVVREIQ
jgi:maltose O-acetyltransferase